MKAIGASENWLYEANTVFDQIVIFGAKECPVCKCTLAACTDYFSPDHHAPSGLTCACRRCRRERQLRRDRRKVAAP